MIKIWTMLDDLVDVKKGDRFTLECDHEGRIIWISSDRETICVRGINRRCKICGKSTSGGWVPTCYLISVNDVKKMGEKNSN